MLHVYKQGGAWTSKDGESYTIKAVNSFDLDQYLNDGWTTNLEDAFSIKAEYKPVETSDYEGEMRQKIKSLGGTASSRSKLSTLEKQLKALENDNKKD